MLILKKGCCGCTIKTSTIVIGYATVVISILILIFSSHQLMLVKDKLRRDNSLSKYEIKSSTAGIPSSGPRNSENVLKSNIIIHTNYSGNDTDDESSNDEQSNYVVMWYENPLNCK